MLAAILTKDTVWNLVVVPVDLASFWPSKLLQFASMWAWLGSNKATFVCLQGRLKYTNNWIKFSHALIDSRVLSVPWWLNWFVNIIITIIVIKLSSSLSQSLHIIVIALVIVSTIANVFGTMAIIGMMAVSVIKSCYSHVHYVYYDCFLVSMQGHDVYLIS